MEICLWSYCSPPCRGFLFWASALLLRMTLRSLEKMPHLQEVFGIIVRDSHLQFECQSETTATRKNRLWLRKGMNTKVKDLTPSFWCLFVYPRLSCFAPFAASLPLIRAPPCPSHWHLLHLHCDTKIHWAHYWIQNLIYLQGKKRPQTPRLCLFTGFSELNWGANFFWTG